VPDEEESTHTPRIFGLGSRYVAPMAGPEVVVAHVHFPEGPVWCPDGTLVFTSVADGALYRVDPGTGERSTVAVVGGGANAAAPAADGGFLVTQNGGIDFTGITTLDLTGMPPYAPVTPGLLHVAPDGSWRYLLDHGFLAPNDLTAGADGTLYFTDPPHHPPPPDRIGRVHAVDPDGTVRVVADAFAYCNGIALEPGGTLCVIEARGVLRLDPTNGEREWIVESFGDHAGDGLALDAEGRLYVCCTSDHAVRVFEPDGREVDRLQVPGSGLLTNCCFGGADGRTLFVTEGAPGAVWAFADLPTPGLAVHAWPVPGRR